MAKGSKPPKGPEKKQDDFQHKFFRKYPTAQAGLPTTTSTETDIEQEPVRKTVKRFGRKLLDATYHLGVTIVYLGGYRDSTLVFEKMVRRRRKVLSFCTNQLDNRYRTHSCDPKVLLGNNQRF